MDEAMLPGTPYRIVRRLGDGAMGEVFEAVHIGTGERRAVKVLAAHLAHRPDLAERMTQEARLLSSVIHPNLVAVRDLGLTTDGRLWFGMELLEGHTLRRTIDANAPVRPELAIDLVLPILAGLGAAHAAGIVHRDIKPENIFVCATGDVKVLDFGVAKVGQTAATLTQTGFTIGTPRYMAPEQVEGKASDARTDLYATALLLYELLTGAVPFDEREALALAFSIVTRPPTPPSTRLAERGAKPIPVRLDEAVLRALSKSREMRFATADAMAAELRACLLEPVVSSRRGDTVRMVTQPRSIEAPAVVSAPKSLLPLLLLVAGVVVAFLISILLLAQTKPKPALTQPSAAPIPTRTIELSTIPTAIPTPDVIPTESAPDPVASAPVIVVPKIATPTPSASIRRPASGL